MQQVLCQLPSNWFCESRQMFGPLTMVINPITSPHLYFSGIAVQIINAIRKHQITDFNRSKHIRNTILVMAFLMGALLDVTSYWQTVSVPITSDDPGEIPAVLSHY